MSERKKYLDSGPADDHDCMDHRQRVTMNEGDDVLVEQCAWCGRIRYETDGARPMAWHIDPSNPTGHRYAHQPSRNDPDQPTPWKFAPRADPTRGTP